MADDVNKMLDEEFEEFDGIEVKEDEDVRAIRKAATFNRVFDDETGTERKIDNKVLFDYDVKMTELENKALDAEKDREIRRLELELKKRSIENEEKTLDFNKKIETVKTVTGVAGVTTIIMGTVYEVVTGASLFGDCWKILKNKTKIF